MSGRERDCKRLRDAVLRRGAAGSHRGPLLYHEGREDLTEAIKADARAGAAVCITGGLAAEIQFVVAAAGANEVLMCLQSRLDQPELACRMVIPPQQVGSSYCAISGSSVLRMAMEAFEQGYALVLQIHSHGRSSSFTSNVDIEQLIRQARERIGQKSVALQRMEGQIRRLGPAAGEDGDTPPVAEAVFAECPEVKVRIHGAAADRALRVELQRGVQQVASCFATTNLRSDLVIPTLRMQRCTECGNARIVDVRQSEEVALHVFGPVELSERRAEELMAEVRRNVQQGGWSPYAGQAAATRPADVGLVLYDGPDAEAKPVAAGPAAVADYRITRNGFQAAISPAVLEEAAAKCPRLAEQLGWAEPAARGERGSR